MISLFSTLNEKVEGGRSAYTEFNTSLWNYKSFGFLLNSWWRFSWFKKKFKHLTNMSRYSFEWLSGWYCLHHNMPKHLLDNESDLEFLDSFLILKCVILVMGNVLDFTFSGTRYFRLCHLDTIMYVIGIQENLF